MSPVNPMSPMNPSLVTRFVGNCQLCEADHKLDDRNMVVHHGYRRPGDGMIHGDCAGVGHEPYEVSCEHIKTYLTNVEKGLPGLRKRLNDILNRTVTSFEQINWRTMSVTQFAVGVSELYGFEHVYNNARYETEAAIRQDEMRLERFKQRIAAWKPAPIRTVEEEARKEQAVRDKAKAEREAARAVRQAKRAATAAKQAALKARREAEMAAFDARLIAAAKLSPSRERSEAAAALRRERWLKKNEWMWGYKHSEEASHAIVTLGIGTLDHRGFGHINHY